MRSFGELEAAVMDRLWAAGKPVTVREVLDDLRGKKLAYTTVMTVLDNLHRKGWLIRELDGRAYRYTPTHTREAYTAQLMEAALATTGDRAAALAHFVEKMTLDEADALRTALRSARRRRP